MKNSIDYVSEYARAVYRGDIVASDKNIKAAKRHLNDLKRKDFEYQFDVERANKVIRFVEKLPDPKTGKLLKLASFQKFILGSKYGWVDTFGNRRFTKSYVSMSRKNGKTLLISGEGLYELMFGKDPAYERLVGLTANSREQAGIAFDMVKAQLDAIRNTSPMIKERTKITESIKEMVNLKDRSKIKAVSNEASNLEGYQFSYAVIDEFHEARDKKMYETLRRGQVLLNNPGLHVISTAGFNLNGPMYEEYKYVDRMLDGSITNDNYFAFVAEQDSADEIHDSSTWIKSNPLLENKEIAKTMLKNLEAEVKESQEKNDLNGILVKNFNLWRKSSNDTYISAADWEACATEEVFNPYGREVYIGVDLSRRSDLTAISFIYPIPDDKYYVDCHVFVGHKGGLQMKSERDKIDYEKLVDTGFATLTDTESGIINDKQVFEWIIDFINTNKLNVKSVMYDPWHADNLIVAFEDYTYPLVSVGQNYKSLSGPLNQFKLDVFEQKIIHGNNPNLNIAINNAVEKTDNNGNIILDKMKNREKIDAIVATITAFSQAMHHEHNSNFEDYIMSSDFGF